MQPNATLKETLDRNARALELRPALGRNTAITRIHHTGGLACEVNEGPWSFRVDMSPKSGGAGSAPNPGVFGRASLGSCLAIGYAMWAARLEVPIDSLDVEIQADFDSRPEYGVPGGTPGYEQVRCIVTISSPASQQQLDELFAHAHAGSSYLHVWRDPQPLHIEIRRK